jgi:cytochrome c
MPLFKSVGRLSIAVALLYSAAMTSTVAQDANQGGRLAEKYCARCHAIGTTGDSPHPSAPPFREIAAKGNVDDLQEALAEGITVGHPDMPEFELPPEQVASFLAYLKSLAPSGR